MDLAKALWRKKKIIVTILTPLVFLPLALKESQISKVGYGLLVVATYWITEAFPIPVTSLLPLIIFPILGVIPVRSLAGNYVKDITFMFYGGIGVALGIEQWNLHKRFALGLLRLMGTRLRWVLLSLMLATYFISLWISNTATTTMMLPVSLALCNEILRIQRECEQQEEQKPAKVSEKREENASDVEASTAVVSRRPVVDVMTASREELDEKTRKMVVLFTLCIAYSATTGGSASLTGTGSNLVTKDLADEVSNGESKLSFASWLIFGFPVGLLNVLILWVWLQILLCGPRTFFGCGKKENEKSMASIKETIRNEYKKLGPIRFAEVGVLLHFLVLLALWLTYDSEFFDGWKTYFKYRYVSNAMPAVLVMTIMFIFPSQNPFRRSKNNYDLPQEPGAEDEKFKGVKTLLTWKIVHSKMPWGMLLLIGCGFGIAETCKVSGFADWIGQQAEALEALPLPILSFLLNLIVSFFTEITSNNAAIAITQPVVLGMAKRLRVHPLYLMLPANFGGNFAYILPCAGIPNAIAFSYGIVKVSDMIKAGFVMNFTSCLVVALGINTWGYPLFDLGTFPAWAETNATSSVLQ